MMDSHAPLLLEGQNGYDYVNDLTKGLNGLVKGPNGLPNEP